MITSRQPLARGLEVPIVVIQCCAAQCGAVPRSPAVPRPALAAASQSRGQGPTASAADPGPSGSGCYIASIRHCSFIPEGRSHNGPFKPRRETGASRTTRRVLLPNSAEALLVPSRVALGGFTLASASLSGQPRRSETLPRGLPRAKNPVLAPMPDPIGQGPNQGSSHLPPPPSRDAVHLRRPGPSLAS